jgi:hypothetical protein
MLAIYPENPELFSWNYGLVAGFVNSLAMKVRQLIA